MCLFCGALDHSFGAKADVYAYGSAPEVVAGTNDDFSFNGSGATTTAVSASSDQDINGLLRGNRWTSLTQSFSFPTLAAQYGSYAHTVNINGVPTTVDESLTFEAFNAVMQTAGRFVFSLVNSFSNLDITENTATPGSATIRLGMTNDSSPTAYAYFPSGSIAGGDVWMGRQTTGSVVRDPQVGNYAWATHLHEIGHALGLKHGHETGGVANVAMTSAHDSMEYSIMTYRSYVGDPLVGGYSNETWGYAQTFMMYDIAALQYMYGADFTTAAANIGNTVYTFSTTTGEMFIDGAGQGAPGGNRVFRTLWDGGGTDTYDFSNYTTNQTIDLTPGGHSLMSTAQQASLGAGNFARGNLFNALQYQGDTRSLIENANGGSGTDTITGNATHNVLRGNGGNDSLTGSAGYDTSFYSDASGLATWRYNANGTWTVTTPAGNTDTLSQMELLQFSDRSLRLWRLEGEDLAGDFNGDGRDDTLFRNSAGAVVTWESSATGTNAATVSHGAVGYQYDIAGVGDFGGAGNTDDILLRDASNGTLTFWSMNSTATSAGSIALPLVWHVHSVSDFNGDGTDDLLLRNATSNDLVIWQMSNFGVGAGGGAVATVTGTWRLLGTGDFNGDLREDMLWYNSANNALTTWEMNGAAQTGGGVLGTLDSTWAVQGIADFNGDGRDDILWRHNSGALAQWQMNGSTVTTSAVFNSLTPNWQIQTSEPTMPASTPIFCSAIPRAAR